MNKKGQMANYALVLMLAVVVIILGMSMAKPLNDANNESRTNMNCTGTTDDFVSAGCLINDIGQAYFIGGIIALAGVIVGARVLFGT